MKYLLPVLMLLLVSCVAPAPGTKKLDITLRNTTEHPIEIKAKAGFFSRTIRLEPGQAWIGWIPPFVPVSEVEIEVGPATKTR